jgi:hypothetical protein
MLHEAADRDAILRGPALGNRGQRYPVAAEQPVCDPAGTNEAHDAANDARERNAEYERHVGVGKGIEARRVRWLQRKLHGSEDGKQVPTRAVAGRAAIQPNSTNVGMSAAISISIVVMRGKTPNV